MSDTATSGEAPVAPAETVSAPPAPVANTAQTAPAAVPASFGTSRGSGLARGKRASTPATNSSNNAPAASGEYNPTAVQLLTSQRDMSRNASSVMPVATNRPMRVPADVIVKPKMRLKSVKPLFPPKPVSFRKNSSIAA